MTDRTDIPILASIGPLARTSRAWISDIWGVLHNGREAYPAAAEACRRFRREGGTVVLVSNAPQRASWVEAMLARLGVAREAWDAVVTSGDVTRALIAPYRGESIYHLGPDYDRGIFEGLDVALGPLDTARAVVCTGLFHDDHETPQDYRGRLADIRARGLDLICVNPDLVVERGARVVYCAGALAQVYEELGGRVLYAGKPHPPIYDEALRRIAEARGAAVPRDEILAIGDGIRTDIEGASRLGVRSVFIASALHVPHGATLDRGALRRLFEGPGPRPVAAQAALVWAGD